MCTSYLHIIVYFDILCKLILHKVILYYNLCKLPCTSHDHPSNGWLAPGYKPVLLGRRLKALAFSLGYENAAYTTFPQLRSSHIAFDSSLPLKGYCYYLALTLKRVFKFLYTQFIQCNVMFLLILNVLSYSCFIQPYCTNIISFSPEMTIPKFIL